MGSCCDYFGLFNHFFILNSDHDFGVEGWCFGGSSLDDDSYSCDDDDDCSSPLDSSFHKIVLESFGGDGTCDIIESLDDISSSGDNSRKSMDDNELLRGFAISKE